MHRVHRAAVALALTVLAVTGPARADHSGHAGHAGHDGTIEQRRPFEASASLQMAEFDGALYTGRYQGITPSVGWNGERLGVRASLGIYHLTRNGLARWGAGDAAVAGHATVIVREAWQAGAALHLMLPTGSDAEGFGMGHAMAMPSLWAAWRAAPVTLTASAGYGRALASLGDGSHDHGQSPLVDPMNMEEVTWSAGADLAVGRGVQVGGRAQGGIAIGAGHTRVIGGGRVQWRTGRVSTGLELQLGLAGDPFTVRGVVDTALRF